ncbi:hypothetical protein NPX13_g1450 [Xylaria arbuscula]|uniref:Uncharacterized protein n=1 Tax=Xylaria arbuscula TaxID=114810 RepID=A0A9W8TQ54_9PEZI|nr:hypothetical protein NPX13_g1450 [Xylaria arbuscula]
MKFTTIVVFATSVAAVAVNFDVARRDAGALVPRHHQGQAANGRNRDGNGGNNANNNNNNDNNTDDDATDDSSSTDNTTDDGSTTDDTANGAVTGETVVLTEIGGVADNECLTFRNNGEIVDAACVNDAADRQMTPSTINGASALSVQRAFDTGFRPDLVDVASLRGV